MRLGESCLPDGTQNASHSTLRAIQARVLRQLGSLFVSVLISGLLTQPTAAAAPQPTAYDFDGNGIRDLLWRDSQNGDLAIWLMDGSTTAVKTVVFAGVDRAWQITGVGDLDGDGKADLLWRNTQNGDVAEWLMNGATVKTWSTLVSGLDLAWQVTGVGDLDGDGKADLVWRNTQNGDVAEWLMNGGAVKSYSTLASGFDRAWQVTGVGDLDGDGKADLVWRNAQSGDAAEWLMNGASVKSYATLAAGLDRAWQITGVGDLDGDGKADLVWRNTQTGDAVEWLMDGAALKSWSLLFPGSQWANIPFTPILADHLKVELFTMNLVQTTFNQTTITEYLPMLRLAETGGKFGISVSVRLAVNGSSFFLPPITGRVEKGSSREILNNASNGTSFSGTINSISAQISYTDDAGQSGVVTVTTLPFNALYPAVGLDWQNQ